MIRPQLQEDIAESQDWDDEGLYYPEDFYQGEYTQQKWDSHWLEKANDVVDIIKRDKPTLDEIMESDLQYWYKPDTSVRDDMFYIADPALNLAYGPYWLHPKSPWTPDYAKYY